MRGCETNAGIHIYLDSKSLIAANWEAGTLKNKYAQIADGYGCLGVLIFNNGKNW